MGFGFGFGFGLGLGFRPDGLEGPVLVFVVEVVLVVVVVVVGEVAVVGVVLVVLPVVFVVAMPRPAPRSRKHAVSASVRAADRKRCLAGRFIVSVHAQRAIRLAREKLPDELVV